VKVEDIPPSDVAVAWRSDENSLPVLDFVTVAYELATAGG
jgi:hypothetical protein